MEVTKSINNFRNFILHSWEGLSFFLNNCDDPEEMLNNWLQANWEILIESTLTKENEYLEVYGFGADCNGESSRVCYPDKLPTRRILCYPTNGKLVKDYLSNENVDIANCDFMGFVSLDDNYYKVKPPFDFVLLSKDSQFLIHFEDVIFVLELIPVSAGKSSR